MLALLHIQSLEHLFSLAIANRAAEIPNSSQSLMFAVYFAAVTSTSKKDLLQLQIDKGSMLSLCRETLEKQLAIASASSTAELHTLQALLHLLV